MKRAYVLLLALLLMLTGCAGKGKTNNVSVKDVCCPYEIHHKKGVVEITLQDGEKRGILWRTEVIPEDICQVIQEDTEKDYITRYRLSGKEEGAAQLTFSALQEDASVPFVLTLVVNVDSAGNAVVSSYRHQARADISVDAGGLQYKWSADKKGTLDFSFTNQEDSWSVHGDGENGFLLSNKMSTPAGCKFSVQSNTPGQTTVVLMSENSQRTIHVVIQADDQGNLKVISVQEQ